MQISMISDFILDVKNWVYNWDAITFAIVVILLSLLSMLSLISIIKGALGSKPKFKIVQFIFLALLITMLVLILLIKV